MYNFWTLVRFEYKKLFKKKAVWLLLPLLMTFSVLSVVVPSFSASISNSETGQTCTMYEMQQTQRRESSAIKGRLIDDSLLQEMRTALDSDKILGNGLPASIRYDGIRSFILSSVGDFLKIEDGSQFTGSADELYALRAEAIKENWAEDGLTKGEKQFLSEKEDSLEIPFSYGYSGSYDMIASSMITVSAHAQFPHCGMPLFRIQLRTHRENRSADPVQPFRESAGLFCKALYRDHLFTCRVPDHAPLRHCPFLSHVRNRRI